MHFSTDNILQEFHTTWLPGNIRAAMLRLDRIHPLVQGNKWFKLKRNLEAAGNRPIVTFGGAYSNHIVAAAAACKLTGQQITGIIRGEAPAQLSHSLQQARELGMALIFVSRDSYAAIKKGYDAVNRTPADQLHIRDILHNNLNRRNAANALPDLSDVYIIPEGGHNPLGAEGCEAILSLADTRDFTHILCSVGSGTTIAGLVNDVGRRGTAQQIIGISALKGALSLDSEVSALLKAAASWQILHGHHLGGFAKSTPELIEMMNDFYRETQIPLDRVYTGKMMLAFRTLAAQHYFPAGSRVLLIHSGGLQGNDSFGPDVLCF